MRCIPILTLGLVQVFGGACASLHSGDQGSRIRVMSYNIEYGHEGLDSVAAVISDQHPDIVGLQEVDVRWSARSSFVDQAAMLAQRTGMKYRFARIYSIPNADPSKAPREFGVALLSRFPIVSFTNHDITRLSTQDSAATPAPLPGLLDVELNVDGRKIRVFNVHLDYRSDPSVREKQVSEIVEYINKDTISTILTGDMNASPDAPELKPLMFRMNDTLGDNATAKATFPSAKPEKKIDYVLTTDSFCPIMTRTPTVYASDHFPVVVDLVLGGKCKRAR